MARRRARRPETPEDFRDDQRRAASTMAPGDDELAGLEPPAAEPAPTPAPAAPSNDTDPVTSEPYFRRLRELTADDWAHHTVFLYRVDPKVMNAGRYKYIAVFDGPFDESDVKRAHGGGTYKAMLKDKASGVLVQEWRFSIEGPAVFLPGQVLGDGSPAVNPASAPAASAPAAAGNGDGAAAAVVTAIMDRLAPMLKPDVKQDDVFKSLMDLQRKGMEGVLEMVTAQAKQQVGSTTGHPLLDRLLEGMISKMASGPEAPKRSSIEDALIKSALDRLNNPQPTPAASGAGVLAELTGLKDLLGGKDALLDLLMGGRAGKEDWKKSAFDFGQKLLEQAPALMDRVVALSVRSQQLRAARQHQGGPQPARAALPPAPARPAAPAPVVPIAIAPAGKFAGEMPGPLMVHQQPAQQPQPAAEPEPAPGPTAQPSVQGIDTMEIFDTMLATVVNAFNRGEEGETAAVMLKCTFAELVPLVQPYLRRPIDALHAWAKTHPVLQEIAGDEEFPAFLEEFVTEILRPDEAPPAAPNSGGDSAA